MSLGYALVHPNRIDVALQANPRTSRMNDAVDVVTASFGMKNPGEQIVEAYVDEIAEQFGDVADQLQSLIAADGPFKWLFDIVAEVRNGALDIGEIVEETADFLAELNPFRLQVLLKRFVGEVFSAAPILSAAEIWTRIKTVGLKAIEVFEGPLLGGRDDLQAHRGYRAAAMMRSLIRPLLREVDRFLEALDLKKLIEGGIDVLVANISPKIIEIIALIGRKIKEYVVPLTASVSAIISGGVQISVTADGMPDEVRYSDDLKPAPHPMGAIWAVDLVTGVLCVWWSIFDYQRSNPWSSRADEHVAYWLQMCWEVTRTVVRAVRPDFLQREYTTWSTFWFSEWGDFFIQLSIMFIGAIGDYVAWDNTCLSWAMRLAKYYTYMVQSRLPYLVTRAIWYLLDWKAHGKASNQPISVSRFIWAVWAAPWFISTIFGLALPWGDLELDEMGGGVIAGIITSICTVGLSGLIWWLVFRPFSFRYDGLEYLFWSLATAFTLLFAISAFEATPPGEEAPDLFYLFTILLLFIPLPVLLKGDDQALTGCGDVTVGIVQVFVSGIAVAGIMPLFMWWYISDDGRDENDLFSDFEDDKMNTSPWYLPFRKEETWLCGQGYHGIFSHNGGQDCSYDFNNEFGANVLASRPGFVVNRDNDFPNGNIEDGNNLRICHFDWVEGFDPGTDEERTINYGNYHHFSQGSIRVMDGAIVDRGCHLANIDDTGNSSVHHLHFAGFTLAIDGYPLTNERIQYPVLFRDDSVRRWRTWVSKPGKACSFCYYESENAEKPYRGDRYVWRTAEAAINKNSTDVPNTNHTHELHINTEHFKLDGTLTDGWTALRTTVVRGHVHEVSRADVEKLIGIGLPGGVATTEKLGHLHQLVYVFATRSETPSAAMGEHNHDVPIELQHLGTDGNISSSVTVTSASAGTTAHTHTVDRGVIKNVLNGDEDEEINTDSAHDHNHMLQLGTATRARDVDDPTITLAQPPEGQLVAKNTAPYNLAGEQMVFRVNDAATEYFSCGAERPGFLGDVALDRGPHAGAGIDIGGNTQSVSNAMSARAAARALSAEDVFGGDYQVGIGGGHRVVRVEPCVVIETRACGTGKNLLITKTDLETLGVEATADISAHGTGFVPDLSAIPRGSAAQLFSDAINLGGAASPPAISTALPGSGILDIQLNGSPVADFSGSAPRISQVLDLTYDKTGHHMHAAGHLPLSAGIVSLDNGTDTRTAILCAASARVTLATADYWLAEVGWDKPPLNIEVYGRAQWVQLRSEDNELAKVAQRIMLEAEGVRAWAEGTNVVVETVAKGPGARLQVSRTNPGDSSTSKISSEERGSAALLANSWNSLNDSTCVSQVELKNILDDAVNWSHPNTTPPTVTVTLDSGTDKLRIAADTGHDLSITGSPGMLEAFKLTAGSGNSFESSAGLDANIALPESGWIDFVHDPGAGGPKRRLHLHGEPARIEVGPFTRLPRSGDDVKLTVNGSLKEKALTSDVTSIDQLAFVLAELSDDITVRLAYRYRFENTNYTNQTLSVAEQSGLFSAGFLKRPLPTTIVPNGRVADHHEVQAGGLDHKRRWLGPLRPAFSASVLGTGQVRVSCSPVSATLSLTATRSDAFGFTAVGGATHQQDTAQVDVDLKSESVTYALSCADAGSGLLVETEFELNAQPAAFRFPLPIDVDALEGLELSVEITAPDKNHPGSTLTTTTQLHFTNLSDRQRVAEFLNCGIPQAKGYCVWDSPFSPSTPELHLETLFGGTDWKMELTGNDALLALGAHPSNIDDSGKIVCVGAGNVRDGRRVAAEELVAAVTRADTYATQVENNIFTVALSGGGSTNLELDSASGQVTLGAPLTSAEQHLSTTQSGNMLTLTSSGTFELRSGWIEIAVGGNVKAAAPIWGYQAVVQATGALPTDAATVSAQLGQLRTGPFEISIDTPGTAMNAIVVDAATDSFEKLVNQLTNDFPAAYFSLEENSTGDKLFTVASRARGKRSRIRLRLPAANMLGFSGGPILEESGDGVFDDLGAVTPADLQTHLEAARDRAGVQQSYLSASFADGQISVNTTGLATTARISAAGTIPGGVAFTAGDTMIAAFAADREVEPGQFEIAIADTGEVDVLVFGEPARLSELTFPTDVTGLNGKTLSLTVDSQAVDVTFAAVNTQGDAVYQITHAAKGTVRTRAQGGKLFIETLKQGSAASIELLSARTGTDALPELSGVPENVNGAGSVPDLASVTGEHYAAVINKGYKAESVDRIISDNITTEDHYNNPEAHLTDEHALCQRLRSNKLGCRSSVKPLLKSDKLPFYRSLEQGPAVRAGILIEPVLDSVSKTVVLSGTLPIALSHSPHSGRPNETVNVVFDGSAYDPKKIADTIHQALYAKGLGSAAAYPDGKVVVESNVAGLCGWIQIPAGTPDSSIVTGLQVDESDKKEARGWPGAAMHPTDLIPGFRSSTDFGQLEHGVTWKFQSGTYEAGITLASAHGSIDDLVTAVDTLLSNVPDSSGGGANKRIALCRKGTDNALYIEAMPGEALTLEVTDQNGNVTEPVESSLGRSWDLAPDPGLGLRRTDILRTYRYVYDKRGRGGPDADEFQDTKWIRVPTSINTGVPVNVSHWLCGRYCIASRAEAGRAGSDQFNAHAEMVISGGEADVDGENTYFLHQVRYGVELQDAAVLRVFKLNGDFLFDVIKNA